MKKEFTLIQKALGICAVVACTVGVCLVWVTFQLSNMAALEAEGTAKILEENEVSRLIAQANHSTTKMATAFKNVLLRGETEGAADKHKKEFEKHVQEFGQTTAELAKIPALAADPERVKAVQAWQGDFSSAASTYANALAQYDPSVPGQYKTLDKMVSGIDRPVVKAGLAIEAIGQEAQAAAIDRFSAELAAAKKRLLTALYSSMGFTLIFLCASLMVYARSVRQSLGVEPRFLAEQAAKIASGDLQSNDLSHLKSQQGSVAAMFEAMRLSLLGLVKDIRDRTNAAERSLDSIRQQLGVVDESAVSQSNSSAGMAAGIEEMSANIAQLFDVADQTRLAAEGSSTESESGLHLVESTSEDVEKTAQGAAQLSTTVQELGTQSEQISQIVSVIEDIAEQTNLLALNAAIEAARAGEQGRGFAVVADEVRRLAERTTQSTSEIEQMVSAIQKGTQNVVVEMTGWADRVTASLDRMHQTKSLMGAIRQRAGDVKVMASEVTNSLSEQRSAANMLSTQIEKYAAMSEENASCVSQIRQSLGDLTDAFAQLNQQCDKFKVS
ncbi:MAG TPA: methyl-accepting chemotaxis protein [Limnobacter sp.]|nr:methyl-accepting chemotaxis protein [Limnobacter sp.]